MGENIGTMNQKTIGISLLFIAASLATIGALGHTLTSIPAIQGHFRYEADSYWFNRLMASLILGTTGLYFGAVILWLGTVMFGSKDIGRKTAGLYMLVLSIFPQIVSFIALPLLTPSDWPHMIIHGIVIVLIPLGIFLRR